MLVAFKIASISSDLQNHVLQASATCEDPVGTLRWFGENEGGRCEIRKHRINQLSALTRYNKSPTWCDWFERKMQTLKADIVLNVEMCI